MIEKKVEGCGLVCIDYIQDKDGVICDLGGTCANVLSFLHFFGWKSTLWMPLYEKKELSELLESRGVCIQYFAKTKKKVPEILQFYDSEVGKHCFITRCPKCNYRMVETCLPTEKHVKTARALSTLFFCDRISKGILSRARETKRAGGITMYEPNGLRTYSQLLENGKKFDIIKFSDERICDSWQQNLLRDLEQEEVKILIVTKGEAGVRFAVKPKWVWTGLKTKNYARKKDSSGAGDWLTAVFLDYIMSNMDYEKKEVDFDMVTMGLQCAMRAAELSCKERGAQGILHNAKRINELEMIMERSLPEQIPSWLTKEGIRCSNCGELIFPQTISEPS